MEAAAQDGNGVVGSLQSVPTWYLAARFSYFGSGHEGARSQSVIAGGAAVSSASYFFRRSAVHRAGARTPETINRKQPGGLQLTGQQEDLLVAFLNTLTDGYTPPEKQLFAN